MIIFGSWEEYCFYAVLVASCRIGGPLSQTWALQQRLVTHKHALLYTIHGCLGQRESSQLAAVSLQLSFPSGASIAARSDDLGKRLANACPRSIPLRHKLRVKAILVAAPSRFFSATPSSGAQLYNYTSNSFSRNFSLRS